MDDVCYNKLSQIIGPSYASRGNDALRHRDHVLRDLLSQQRIPDSGLDSLIIRSLLDTISIMDSNNFHGSVGVGEREGRVFRGTDGLVGQRNFGISHGIGRSGDIAELQPKAAGSSLLSRLLHQMIRGLFTHTLKMRSVKSVLVLPVATGMALTLSLLALRHIRGPAAQYVVWCRIDQKTCLKCIHTAGFKPVVVEGKLVGDEVQTDMESLKSTLLEIGAENLVCVLTTTSCFAPRVPDNIVSVAELCKLLNVPHIVNNAYGLQMEKCCNYIEQATNKGRVDCFVQSTDKNFMVPVGGSIIASSSKEMIKSISQVYPGRASASPLIDLFIQLLSMGTLGYVELLHQRKTTFEYFGKRLSEFAASHGERVLHTPRNHVSYGMTLDSIAENHNMLGSMLFNRNVSGARVYSGMSKNIIGIHFPTYGAHHNAYPHKYINVAAAIGMSNEDVNTFLSRLDKCIQQMRRHGVVEKPIQTARSNERNPADVENETGPSSAV